MCRCSLVDHQDRPPSGADFRAALRDGPFHGFVSERERLVLSRKHWDEKSRSKLFSYFGKKTIIRGFKCYGYPWLVFVGTTHDAIWKDGDNKAIEKVPETNQLPLSVLRAWANRGWVTVDEKISPESPRHGHLAANYVIRMTDEARDEIKKMKA